MSATHDSTVADPQQIIAELKRELARRTAERDEALARETATAEVLGVINSSPGDLGPVFDAMLEKATRLCEAPFGLMSTYDGQRFQQAASYNVPAPLAAFYASDPVQPGPETGLGRIARGAELIHITDLSDPGEIGAGDPRRQRLVELGGVRSYVVAALRKDGRLLGTIAAYRQEMRPFTDKQIALLQNFAAQAVIAMENARLLTETREALEQQTATAEVLGVINSSPGDLGPVFDAMLEKATRLCDAAFGMLWTCDNEYFRAVASHQVPPRYAEFLFANPFRPAANPHSSSAPSALYRLAQGEDLVRIDDVSAAPAYRSGDPRSRALVELGRARSYTAVALRKDGRLLGGIAVYRQEVRPFTDKQIALLQNFAAQAVIAMENARLLTETREALDQQTATAEVLGVINSSPGDLAPVFDAMLEKAMRLCEAVFGVLWTTDGETFSAAALRGVPAAYAEFVADQRRRPEPETALGRLLSGERFVHVADVTTRQTNDQVVRKLVELGGVRTLLAVPLRRDCLLLGAFVIYRQAVRSFSDKQIALLQNFAAQAVIAMENARLITETREALEQQTATAEVLQVINASPGDLAPVFDAILEKATGLCDAAFGTFRRYDGERFHLAASRGASAALLDVQREPRPPGPLSRRLLTGETVIHVPDIVAGDAYQSGSKMQRALVELGGAHSYLMVALRKEERLLGYFSFYRQEVRPFTDKQIALLQNFAAQAVIAMENARLLGELRQSTEEVAELNRGLEARVAEQVEELGRVGRLKRFLAPQLAELIVSQGDEKILESHRREIVVVFCDLRGYTAFTETAEPEEVLDFLREYHGALGPLVAEYEGTLDQFSGDGIMVFFNDPVPLPDPAERAVRMAIAMRAAAATLIAAWQERGRDLGFGAGIAQGYATLGQIGFSERSGYTAIGTVCNVAARLCAEAKDGQILLSQRVNVALRGSVATEQVGALALKGLAQPVVAYDVPLAATQPALRVIEGGDPQMA